MNLLLLALAGALLGTALADDYLFLVDTSINMKGDRLTAVRQVNKNVICNELSAHCSRRDPYGFLFRR